MWLNGRLDGWPMQLQRLGDGNTGSWEEPGSGYKTLGSGCITHSNRSNKGRKSFVFRCNLVVYLGTVNWAIHHDNMHFYCTGRVCYSLTH